MLKLLFGCLLAANVALFAYNQGYLNTLFPDGREPGRVAKQLNADKIKLLPASAISATPTAAEAMPANGTPASSSATTLPAAASVAAANPQAASCIEIGSFDVAEGKRFVARLASLAMGDRLVPHNIVDGARYIVFIPSQGSKEGADKKASELHRLGVTDFYVMQDSNLRWGISLGIFKTEEAANTHLASLNQQGVRTARIGNYNLPTKKTAYQLRGVDATTLEAVQKIKADFPKQGIHRCEAQQ